MIRRVLRISTKMSNFYKLSKNIGSDIQKIIQNVTSLQKMIAHIGTYIDDKSFATKLQEIERNTQALAKDTSKNVKQLNDIYDQITSIGSQSNSEKRQMLLQKERVTNDFINALNNFKTIQEAIAKKEKEAIQRVQNLELNQSQTGKINDSPFTYAKAAKATIGYQKLEEQLQEEDYNIEQLEEREKAIRQLESDIVDVNTIFKDLATMVHEQGEIVDSIEANVESTTVRVHEGADQLRQAEMYKNKARKKKVILSIVGVTILVILIAIIAWQAN